MKVQIFGILKLKEAKKLQNKIQNIFQRQDTTKYISQIKLRNLYLDRNKSI